MNGGTRILSRYATAEADRLTCAATLVAAVTLSVVGCWVGSQYVGQCNGATHTLAWPCRPTVLLWHALPGVWWVWMFFRARTPQQRLVSHVVFAIAVWTFWVGIWTPHSAAGGPMNRIAFLLGPMLAGLVLLALIRKRRALWRIAHRAVDRDGGQRVETSEHWASEVLVDGKVRTVRTAPTGLRRRASFGCALLAAIGITLLAAIVGSAAFPHYTCACHVRKPMALVSCCIPAAWCLWLFIRAKSRDEHIVAWIIFALVIAIAP